MDIVSRLKQFIDYLQMQNSQFADTAQIPRPTLSQILNGRNKKISNELIAKLHDAFPQLNVMWLMFGDGDMVSDSNIKISQPQNKSSLFNSTIQDTDNAQGTVSEYEEPAVYNFMPEKFSEISGQNFSQIKEDNISRQNTITTHQEHKPLETQQNQQHTPQFAPPGYERKSNHINTDTRYRDSQYETRNQSAHYPSQQEQLPFQRSMPSEVRQTIGAENCNNKRITHITVFYSDNSYQIYIPSDK